MKFAIVLTFGFFLVLCFVPSGVSAQTGDEIETLLASPRLNYGQAARFVLEASEAAVLQSPGDAFDFAMEKKWLPKNVQAGSPVSLGGLSLLIMRSFDLGGGLFYSLFKNPHYSYRELVYQKMILGKTDPEQSVSGDLLLQIIGRVLAVAEQKEEAERRLIAAEINARLEAMKLSDTRAEVGSEGVTISLFNVSFGADSAQLEAAAQRRIQEIAEILKAIPGRRILVAGHTALAGTTGGQIQLSTERAQAVADYLVQLGARRSNEVTVRGYGASRPVADNATPRGQAQNRRVEITILE
jgi:outer membrane protein OmpA-like peptidoglycan-associated protein